MPLDNTSHPIVDVSDQTMDEVPLAPDSPKLGVSPCSDPSSFSAVVNVDDFPQVKKDVEDLSKHNPLS